MLNHTNNIKLLFTTLTLSLGLMACGDSEDPSSNNGGTKNNNKTTNNTNTGGGTTGGTTTGGGTTGGGTTGGGTTGGGTTGGGTTGGGTTGGSNTTGTNGSNTNTNTGNTMMTAVVMAYGGCNFNKFETGEVEDKNEGNKFGGGVVSTDLTGYAADSGLESVLEVIRTQVKDDVLIPSSAMMPNNPDTYELPTPIQITDAIVTATGRYQGKDSGIAEDKRLPRKYYLQDQKVALAMNLEEIQNYFDATGTNAEKPRVNVGSKVSFKVTKVSVFGSGFEPQIADITDFSVTSAGNDVGVIEGTGKEFGPEDYGKMVRIYGKLEDKEPGMCGAQCFTLLHGEDAAPKSITFRVNEFAQTKQGSCVSYLGPLGAFPSPVAKQGAGDAQLDAGNFAWFTKFELSK